MLCHCISHVMHRNVAPRLMMGRQCATCAHVLASASQVRSLSALSPKRTGILVRQPRAFLWPAWGNLGQS
eukprot:5552731-Pyramimonas_sp.AAC.1